MSDSDFTTPAPRRNIPKKTRFEVFKRDSFTCQYCGRKAPDVILQIDHIHPRSKGGPDDLLNYITSCEDCNAGKGARLLSDDAVVERQRRQLAELQERKEQIDMMFEWQQSLMDLGAETGERLHDFWCQCVPGWSLNEKGQKELREYQRRFGIDEVLTAVQIATEHYLQYDADGKPTQESVEDAWKKVGGVLVTRQRERDNPDFPLQKLYLIRARLRGRLSYWDEYNGWRLLCEAAKLGALGEDLEAIAQHNHNWTNWRKDMDAFIEELADG